MMIENDVLSVRFHDSLPVIERYRHKPTGETIDGDAEAIPLRINGKEIPWKRMTIRRTTTTSSLTFHVEADRISFAYAFALKDNELVIGISDVRGPLDTLGFNGAPILRVSDRAYRYARITAISHDGGGKKWWTEQFGSVGDAESECPVMHGCLYQPAKLCVFAHSNFPLFPERHAQRKDAYEISLSDYRYRVRTRTLWPLEVRVVFLQDYNGDKVIDESDFALWVNRTLPDADELYRTCVSYKIFLTYPNTGVSTTFEQATEIAWALHNVTDGIPQLAYLVGWQFQGHDDKYPSLSQVSPRLGGAEPLLGTIRECATRYKTLVSYHTNIDDAYPDSPDWDPSYMHRDGVIHTLDWERGHFRRRFDEMTAVAPIDRTLHVDNTRICNNHREVFDGIGELEELYCGLLPMAEWFKEKGITLTTEGTNGMPIDGSLVFQGWFHHDCGILGRQMLHRKVVGGGPGRHCGELTAKDYALGSNIHVDFTFLRRDGCVSYTEDFRGMVDRIFLGSLLYLYFLEREQTVCRVEKDGRIHIEYDDGTVVEITSVHTMTVTKGDMVIARDNDTRCIPYRGALYIYAQIGNGEVQTFMLPPEWRGRKVTVTPLTRDGPERSPMEGIEPGYKVMEDRVVFPFMIPYQPFKVTLAEKPS